MINDARGLFTQVNRKSLKVVKHHNNINLKSLIKIKIICETEINLVILYFKKKIKNNNTPSYKNFSDQQIKSSVYILWHATFLQFHVKSI